MSEIKVRRSALAFAAVAILALPEISRPADQLAHWTWKSPVGLWNTTVTFVDCQTGAVLRPPFPAVNSLFADGNVVESGSGLGPASRTPGQGRWAFTGRSTLTIQTQFMLFDVNFIYYADQIMDRRFTMSDDGNAMTGHATFVRIAPDGTEVFRGCATEVATRRADPQHN